MIYANFRAEGPVEKPDVIGAIFGQTEGLLGADMEMRELQKEGKIGRIEVDLESVDGKSIGEIQVPSALDKSETTIIAATLETIDRIGPTEASVEIEKIEDVRGSKRDYIIDRARKLLEGVDGGSMNEMAKTLKDESRAAKIQEYGDEKLPAGDLSGDEIIVVEGRADVVNLLKNRVNNVIGMQGVKMPKEITRLGESKELTLFVDGDRGGKLIVKNVTSNAKISYIAVAPDGKEVEELTGKEILQALRKKIPAKEYLNKVDNEGYRRRYSERHSEPTGPDVPEKEVDAEKAKQTIKEKFESISGSRKALLLDYDLNVVREVSQMEVSGSLRRSRKSIAAVVIDGVAPAAVIKACDEKGVKFLGATNFTSVPDTNVKLISL